MMRNLFIIGMLLVGAFMAGWFKVQRDGERTTIEINRDEIRSDARHAIDRGRDFLERRDPQYGDQQYRDPQSGDQQYGDPQYRDPQYADQQYADQQYADQQRHSTDQGQSQQQYRPQAQVAAQREPRGATYDPRQQPNDPIYYPQDQQRPNQSVDPRQANPYSPQPYYPPLTR